MMIVYREVFDKTVSNNKGMFSHFGGYEVIDDIDIYEGYDEAMFYS